MPPLPDAAADPPSFRCFLSTIAGLAGAPAAVTRLTDTASAPGAFTGLPFPTFALMKAEGSDRAKRNKRRAMCALHTHVVSNECVRSELPPVTRPKRAGLTGDRERQEKRSDTKWQTFDISWNTNHHTADVLAPGLQEAGEKKCTSFARLFSPPHSTRRITLTARCSDWQVSKERSRERDNTHSDRDERKRGM